MKLNKRLAFALPAAALAVVGGAGAAVADDNTEDSENLVLSCDVIEVIDIPILSDAENEIDCSEEYEEDTHVVTKLVDHR